MGGTDWSRTGCAAPPPTRSRCSPGYPARGPSDAARQPGSPSGPSLRAGPGAASPRPYVTGAGVAGAGTGLPGPGKLSGAGAGGAGVNLQEVLRDSRALSSLPLLRCNGGGGGGGSGEGVQGPGRCAGTKAGGAWPSLDGRAEWEGRRGATPRGLGCLCPGGAWTSHPFLPPSLICLLNLSQKTPLVSAPDVPGKLLNYPTTLGNPNSGFAPSVHLAFCFLELRVVCPPP